MKFDIDKYKGRYVMFCEAKKEAKDFCATLGKNIKIVKKK